VLYRWRLHAGKEAQFVEAWRRRSELLLRERGSLGSRLHRGPEGVWYSDAQWPGAEARDRAIASPPVDAEASERLQDAIAERLPALVLEPVDDDIAGACPGPSQPPART